MAIARSRPLSTKSRAWWPATVICTSLAAAPPPSPSCFETHRSAPLAVERLAFASRCDAPQHEGDGSPTNLRLYEMTAIVSAIVIYNDFRNSHVSAALSAQIGFTPMWLNSPMRQPPTWARVGNDERGHPPRPR